MANKHQVLKLLEKGLTPQQVAKKLGCSDGYVRATRLRAEDVDYDKQFPSYRRSNEKKMERYRTDPEYRKRHLELCKARNHERYHSDAAYRESQLLKQKQRYHANKTSA